MVKPISDGMERQTTWHIHEPQSVQDLQQKLDVLNDEYAGNLVKSIVTEEVFRIDHFSVLHVEGQAILAVNYHPYDERTQRDYQKMRHTRPANEFFDGRFRF